MDADMNWEIKLLDLSVLIRVHPRPKFFFCASAFHNFKFRSLKAFTITETELNVIAALAIIGERRIPKTGNRMPAAIGTPTML